MEQGSEHIFVRRERPKGQISALVFCSLVSFFAGAAFWGALQTQDWLKDALGFSKTRSAETAPLAPPPPTRNFDLNSP